MQHARRLGRAALAPLLIIGGLAVVVAGESIGGLALILAGWFARSAAMAGRRDDHLRSLLDGVTVGDIMETGPLAVAPQATLDVFAAQLQGSGGPTVARVIADGRLVGLLGSREVARVPRERWPRVRASEAMAATVGLPVLAPDDPVGPAAERLGATGAPGFPVLEDGRLAGILTRLAVGRTLHERGARATPVGPSPGSADGGAP
jgi:CBS domain-containing protein